MDEHELKKRSAPAKNVTHTNEGPNKENRKNNARPKWVTKAMDGDLSREDVLKVTCIEMAIFLVFMTCVCIFVMGSQSSYNFYLTQSVASQFLGKEFGTINGRSINFTQISSASDVWMVKVRKDSCVVHKFFRHQFKDCYNTYKPSRADKADFGPGIPTAWTYSSEEKTKSMSYSGQISTYGGDGFYVDLQRNRNGSIKIIQDLKKNVWIQKGTRAVFIDVTLHNVNMDLYAICKIVFEFPPVGAVITKAEIYSMKILRSSKKWDVFVWACEITSYVFVAYYLLEEIREMFYFKWRYLLRFWNCIDFCIIASAVAAGIMSLMEYKQVPITMETLRENPDQYANVEYFASMYTSKNNLYAMLLIFVFLKAFKYLNFNSTMGKLSSTLKQCTKDILGFILMFLIVFFAFAELGNIVFGSKVEHFSSFRLAVFTLLRTTLGDFNYDEIAQADRVLGPIYFLLFIFLVFFVLLNMFLAIINDTYMDVRNEIAGAPDELQMTDYLRDKVYKFLKKLGIKKKVVDVTEVKSEIATTMEQIREVLTTHGYNHLEIEMFFSRYNVNPGITLNDADDSVQASDNYVASANQKGTDSVSTDTFHGQQQKLNQIDETVRILFVHVNVLLERLEHMENVKKVKKA